MGTQIFNKVLTTSFVASSPIIISAGRFSIDFLITVAGGAATVVFFLEFAEDDPNAAATKWFAEVAEEDAGAGVVSMPKVLRTFADNAGTTLAVGTHKLSVQFTRQHQFARFSMKESTGGAVATTVVATVPFGSVPVSG